MCFRDSNCFIGKDDLFLSGIGLRAGGSTSSEDSFLQAPVAPRVSSARKMGSHVANQTVSHYVDQAGFKLLASSNPPTLASQSDLVVPCSQAFTIFMLNLVQTPDRHRTLQPRAPELKRSSSLSLPSVHHHTWLIFEFLVEMKFGHVVQGCSQTHDLK
ncbi:hypothetical protein AAY473_030073 [Plecturocebus cupreus]